MALLDDLLGTHPDRFSAWESQDRRLIDRATESDLAEAESAIDRLAAVLPHADCATTALVLLRLRALVASST